MEPLNDIELMDAFKQHQRKAERIIFDRYYRPLCLYTAEITGDIPLAEDIVTESFKKAFDKRAEFAALTNFRAFMYRIVKNAALNAKHQQKNRASILERARFEIAPSSEIDTTVEQHEMLRVELLEEIFKEVENLPSQCRNIFERLFFKGQSTETIARDLSLSINTVRAQKGRAIRLLKSRLLKNGHPDSLVLLLILTATVK